MITLQVLIAILFTHFIGDFVLQSHWMGTNKSKNWRAMTAHISVYTLTLLLLCVYLTISPMWAIANGLLHWGTDAVSSRITSKLWKAGQIHWFFVVIGLDQLIHYTCMFLTYGRV